jgi:diguanylate cyclase (GGDEF)-like protein
MLPSLLQDYSAHLGEAHLVVGVDGRILKSDPAADEMLESESGSLINRPISLRIHPKDRRRFSLEWQRIATTPGSSTRFSGSFWGLGGTVREVHCSLENQIDNPNIAGIFVTAREASDQIRLVAALHAQARTDALTGLPNRLSFEEHLAGALASPTESPVSLAMIDIDHFKLVNDSLGHRAGDELIREVAVRIRDVVRAIDTVARHGGDEIVVLSPLTDLDEAEMLAARIQAALRAPLSIGGTEIHVTASIGVACTANSSGAQDDLLRNADVAMYAAKRQGPGVVTRYDARMVAEATDRLALQSELHRAIEQHEFTVHYQPIVRAETRKITSYEALVRWPRAAGMVLPEGFIPTAESSGLIHDLGDRVLELIVADLCATSVKILPRVWMNLSGQALMRRNCASRILAVASEQGVSLDRLGVEVTETVLMGDVSIVERNLTQLRDHGMSVSLDDYGTGWASLSAIKRFPIDVVKIDRTFTAGLTTKALDRAIVRGVAEIGRVLRLEVVAEGVETDEQAWIAQDLGCTELQGYRYGAAAPLSTLPSL